MTLSHTARSHTTNSYSAHTRVILFHANTRLFTSQWTALSQAEPSQANSHSHSLNLNLHFLFALQAFGSCFNYSMPAHFVSVHKMSTFSTFQTNIFISTASINFYWPVMKLSWHIAAHRFADWWIELFWACGQTDDNTLCQPKYMRRERERSVLILH